MDCKDCIGCQKQEQKDFKEVKNCIYFKSTAQELKERVNEAYANIDKYKQIKI
jgi:hypothetical protein